MKVSILTSGFPNGFTNDFIQCIKEYYDNNGSFLLISSDFTEHLKTERHMNEFLRMFRENGIVFNEVNTVDDRITIEKALEYIEKADVIWLSGGNTLKQIEYIRKYDLIPALQKREGITIGMSAGSINMAKRVVLARDINDNIPELSIYDGIGLVDINIEPHLDSASEEHMKEIYEASQYATIYGIYDNTFIKILDDKMEVYGSYFKYENQNLFSGFQDKKRYRA
jgi:peptidase E